MDLVTRPASHWGGIGRFVDVEWNYVGCSGTRNRFDRMGPHLLEQVPPPLGRICLDQMLFGRGQNSLKANHDTIRDQVGADVFGVPADLFLLEEPRPFTNDGFNFPLRIHDVRKRVVLFPVEKSARSFRRRSRRSTALSSRGLPEMDNARLDERKLLRSSH